VLVRLERPKPHQASIRLVKRKKRHSILTGGSIVTMEQVDAAVASLP
jgi:hypothetical protein